MNTSSLVRQASFHTGELAPEFYGRTDHVAYQTGLRLARNFIPTPRGALVSRPGSKLVAEIKDSTEQVLLVSFVFSDAQTYVLEVGNQYIRFYQNGSRAVMQRPLAWSARNYVVGEIAYFGSDAFRCKLNTTAAQDPSNGTYWTDLGVVGQPMPDLVTPWLTADLPRLKFAQSGDVITVTHQSYAPYAVARLAAQYWTATQIDFTPEHMTLTVSLDTTRTAGGLTLPWNNATNYNIGDYARDLGSNAVYMALADNTNVAQNIATAWTPAADTARVARTWWYLVTVLYRDPNGVVHESDVFGTTASNIIVFTDRPAKINWTAVVTTLNVYKIIGFNIYKSESPKIWGFIGTADATDTSFVDAGITPDFSVQPPSGANPFVIADGANTANSKSYPAAATYHEQRLLFGGSPAKPGTFWGSMIAALKRFDVKYPVIASDPYEFALACVQLEDIRSLLSINGLLIFTGAGVWSARGVNGGVLSPTSVDVRRRSKGGASYLRPLEVRGNALYVTSKANRIRDVRINWAAYGDASFEQNDLSYYSRHLFEGMTLTDWAFAEEPYSIVWAVRSDGTLLSMSYDPASQTLAWAQHQSEEGAATYEAVCSVPEGTEDAVYAVVKRTVQGQTKRYLERFASRLVTDVRTYVGSDCALAYDGRKTDGSTVQIINYTSGLPGGTEADITSTAVSFAPGDVGDVIVLDPDGTDYPVADQPKWDTASLYAVNDPVAYKGRAWRALQSGAGHVPDQSPTWWAPANGPFRCTILSYTNVSQVHVVLDQPVGPGSGDTTKWGIARHTFTGLGHLEGKTLAVLSDGVVQGQVVVAAGQVTLEDAGLMVTVGLPFNCDAELLDLGLDAVKTNVKIVSKVGIEVIGSRGLWAGEDFDHLDEYKAWRRVSDSYGLPGLKTGLVNVAIKGSWNTGGRAVIRQVDPLPLSVVAVTREAILGGRG